MIEKLQAFLKSLNLETVKNAWKEEWTPIALAVAGGVLLLVLVSFVRRRVRRFRMIRASEGDLGYNPQSIPRGVTGLAFQCFLLGTAIATSFYNRD